MSKKKKAVPTVQPKKENTLFKRSGVEMALLEKPYLVTRFRCGGHGSNKYVRKTKDKSRLRNYEE